MTTPIVMKWQQEASAKQEPLTRQEVEKMYEDIRSVAFQLSEAILTRGEHDLDARLRVLHATTEGLRNGDRVRVSVTAKKATRP